MKIRWLILHLVRLSMDSHHPVTIYVITQTMIGDFPYKYTCRTIGKGVGEKEHKCLFWVHPYSNRLYIGVRLILVSWVVGHVGALLSFIWVTFHPSLDLLVTKAYIELLKNQDIHKMAFVSKEDINGCDEVGMSNEHAHLQA